MDGKRVVCVGSLLVMGLFLVGCGAPPPTPKMDNTAGTQIVATFMAQITQTTAAAATPTPTESVPVQEETEEPDLFDQLETSEAPDDFSTATPGPYQTLLSRFRFITVTDGNLYVRDGMGLPKQITQSGQDHDPIISSDGQKIVFYRGEKFDNVVVINADGTGEKTIVSPKLLPALGKGDIKFLMFRPGTYDIIFSTHLCNDTTCSVSIFLVDANSAKITEVVSGLSAPVSANSDFALSPDGQYLAIGAPKKIHLYRLADKMELGYAASVSPFVKSVLPLLFWLPDSSGLIVLMEMQDNYAILRYTVTHNTTEQLSFELPTINCGFSVSPDRNWIFYQKSDKEYALGSLQDVQAKAYPWDAGCAVKWSANSQHFASQTEIGSVDGTPPIPLDGRFIAWLDATHYLFSKGKSILDLQTYIAEVGKEADAVQVDFLWSPIYAVLEPTPAP